MHIAEAERDTGIGKDTLRVWERRYGFPNPSRDPDGERIYSFDQIERLRVIRRLLDKGMRPSKVIGLDLSELYKLLDVHSVQETDPAKVSLCNGLVKLLRLNRGNELRDSLNRLLVKEGLKNFITQIVIPMNELIGNAWVRGDLTIPEEHLYTEQVQNVLRHAIQLQAPGMTPPRILLTTFPDEEHGLGLLMVEAMCTLEGAQCTSLGTRIPLSEISKYARDGRFDVVALSFSAAYPSRDVLRDLEQFRSLLPLPIVIWAGGSGVKSRRFQLSNFKVLTSIEGIPELITQWRHEYGH